jgi:uncharacterized protein (TIGR03083 family)
MEPNSTEPPTVTELVAIWQAELTAVADLCETLTDEQWNAVTPCPGWTVADVVTHLDDVEGYLGGEPRPDHSPDWDALPHAKGDFGRFTEVGVDARRGRPQAVAIAELRDRIARRRVQLDVVPEGGVVMGVRGTPVPATTMLSMRIFDAWVHEEDIRTAVGVDGGWNSDAAGIAFMQIVAALPYVWAHNAKAPVGSTLAVSVIGAGMHHDDAVTVDESGRGVRIPFSADTDVQMSIMWPAYMRLSCGRLRPGDPSLVDRVELTGDPALGLALLEGLTITP